MTGESKSMALAGLASVNATIDDPSRRWMRIGNPVVGLLVREASQDLSIHTVRILPADQLEPEGERRDQVLTVIDGILRHLGVVVD